jgi:SPP1 family predicted phage head-tail adaptor
MAFHPYRGQRIGNLRESVWLQEPVQVGTTESNEPIYEWENRARVHARIEPEKGRERWVETANQRVSDQLYRVYIRYSAAPRVTWRVVWEQAPDRHLVLEVLAISNEDERKRFLKLDCRNIGEAESDVPSGPSFYLEGEPLTVAIKNIIYTFPITVVGGVAPFSFARVDGSPLDEIALPGGLVLSQYEERTFALEGYPDAAGVHSISIRCTDDEDATADLDTFTLTISE